MEATQEAVIYIYSLVDPESEEVRYVGSTDDPKTRLCCHLSDIGRHPSRKTEWLSEVIARGLAPRLSILDSATEASRSEVERRWIARLMRAGHRLTNVVSWDQRVNRKASDTRKDPRGKNPFVGLLTVEEVADLKGVQRSAVVKAIRRARLPAWHEKGQYWIRAADLEAWQPVLGRGRRKKEEL